MKKLSITIMAAAAMFFSVQTTNAQVTGEESAATEQVAPTQEEWTQIKAEELPAEVQAAIEKDLAGITVSETYVKEKDGVKTYKVVVSTADGQTKDLFADANGNWIQNG